MAVYSRRFTLLGEKKQRKNNSQCKQTQRGYYISLILASGLEPHYCANAYWLLCQSTVLSKRRDGADTQPQHGLQLLLMDKLITHEIKYESL